MAEIPGLKATNVVLFHGGFVDGPGWEGVYKILTKDGYTVSVGRRYGCRLGHRLWLGSLWSERVLSIQVDLPSTSLGR